MSLEDDLRNVRPALERAINDAVDVSRRVRPPRPLFSRSRTRVAVAAFVVAAVAAATVGLVSRLESPGPRGIDIKTFDTTSPTLSATTAHRTPSTTSATTTLPATTTSTTQAGVALQSVRWASVLYPFATHCGNVFNPPVSLRQVAFAAPAPGVHVAVVMVSCTVGAGTPPVAVYVYDHATAATAPHLAATLVADTNEWQARAFTINGAMITLPVGGFSSLSVPNCCPDVHATLVWRWTGSQYRLASSVPAHFETSRLP
jgi:hypothetical protein